MKTRQISILKFEILSTIFIMILGTLLHFTFEWSNNNFLIGSFFVAVILGEYFSYKKIETNSTSNCNNLVSIAILLILCLSFIFFTFFPPHIGLFKSPV